MTSFEIRKFIVISTAHVSQASAKLLDNIPAKDWPCVGGSYADYGWFIYAHDENAAVGKDAIPDDLFNVMTWARRQGCDYVLLDCDGEEVEGLPIHDW